MNFKGFTYADYKWQPLFRDLPSVDSGVCKTEISAEILKWFGCTKWAEFMNPKTNKQEALSPG